MRAALPIAVMLVACASSTPAPSSNVERGPTRADRDPQVRVAAPTLSYRVSVHAEHVDVHSDDGFPGRALDPVLVAGDVELQDYEHVDVETLRFRTEQPVGGPFTLRWGNDRYELEP